jgi:hypothetical protein
VRRHRNIHVGIVVHGALNVVSGLIVAVLVMRRLT